MNKEYEQTYNLAGFIIGNGVTDMYLDSDNQLIESLAYWSMIPQELFKQIQAYGCIFYWDKMDVQVKNPPQCADLYNQSMTLIQDLNIYDLYRTQYPDTGMLNKRNRLQHE
jgi:hypothetical protein